MKEKVKMPNVLFIISNLDDVPHYSGALLKIQVPPSPLPIPGFHSQPQESESVLGLGIAHWNLHSKNLYKVFYFTARPKSYVFTVKLYSAAQYREGNGNPLQYSCLENAMDGGAW